MELAVGLEVIERSDLMYANIIGKVTQYFRTTFLIPVFSQSIESTELVANASNGKMLVALPSLIEQKLYTPLDTICGSENVVCYEST
jgi:hypothetical protein